MLVYYTQISENVITFFNHPSQNLEVMVTSSLATHSQPHRYSLVVNKEPFIAAQPRLSRMKIFL